MKKIIAVLLVLTAFTATLPLEENANPSTSPRIESVDFLA